MPTMFQRIKARQWSTELVPLTCQGCRTNCIACCFEPCVYGKIQKRLRPETSCNCCLYCMAASLVGAEDNALAKLAGVGIRTSLLRQQREELGQRLELLALPYDDQVAQALFCNFCVLGQELRELERRPLPSPQVSTMGAPLMQSMTL